MQIHLLRNLTDFHFLHYLIFQGTILKESYLIMKNLGRIKNVSLKILSNRSESQNDYSRRFQKDKKSSRISSGDTDSSESFKEFFSKTEKTERRIILFVMEFCEKNKGRIWVWELN